MLSSFIGVVYVGISLAFVYVCKMLMDIATGDVHARMEVYVGLLICCIVGQISLSAINTRLSVYNDVQLRNNLRYHLFSHLLDTAYIVDRKRRHTGDMLNRLIEDVRIVTNAIGQLFPSILVTSVQFIAAFFFLLY
ncbi:ABC transporter transmembrane domain-containing protein [Parabacteroides absconsus]|uniref:ABC transporter transmembrane domain-containing protein n=1 Tax=Parabacteroides absconsus TaxID=2951805 RepID=UPI003BB1DA4B|nr:ABC transporter transmembrane domain-containing protein [Parabacteroides sp. AD58]